MKLFNVDLWRSGRCVALVALGPWGLSVMVNFFPHGIIGIMAMGIGG